LSSRRNAALAREGEAAAEVNKVKPTIDFFLAVAPAKEVVVYPAGDGAICHASVEASGVKTH